MIKDFYGEEVDVGDFISYIAYHKDRLPTLAKIHSFTKTGTPRVMRKHNEKPFALTIKKCYINGMTSAMTIRQHKLFYVKIRPTEKYLNSIYTK